MGEKRIVFRISDCLNCGYSYKIIKNVRSAKAAILNLSSMGLMMITKEFLKPKKELEITIGKPLGPLTLTAEVLSSKLGRYVTDKNKDMFLPHTLLLKIFLLLKGFKLFSVYIAVKPNAAGPAWGG